MDNEMINKVAQGLKNAGLNCVNIQDQYPQELAIAAIKAMREPTEKMKKTMNEAADWADGESAWEATIEVIISNETFGSASNPIIENDL